MNHDPLCINYGGCDCWKCVTPCNCGEIRTPQTDTRTSHDPLCTWRQAEEADAGDPRRWLAGGLAVCDCALIAKVREDERRERVMLEEVVDYYKAYFHQAEQKGWNTAISDCITAVKAAARDRIYDLRTCNKDDDCYVKADGVALMLDDAIYELRALQEKP